MTVLYIVSVFSMWCCDNCSRKATHWIPRKVFGPFSSVEGAQTFLQERHFHCARRSPRIPTVGELWTGTMEATCHAVICPLAQP